MKLFVSLAAAVVVVATVACSHGRAPLAEPARSSIDTVAVLYFDNATGNTDLDPFARGLADMLVTDLSQVLGVTVVERRKLEALIAEQHLQQSDFIDPTTAAQVGRGLGAQAVVMGTVVGLDPQVSIEARLVAVSTGEVLLSRRAVGAPAALFELEQSLVASLREGLGVGVQGVDAASGPVQTRGANVEVLTRYGAALAAADAGDTEAAARQLGEVVSMAPIFGLARRRQRELAAAVEASREGKDEDEAVSLVEAFRLAEVCVAVDPGTLKTARDASHWLACGQVAAWHLLRRAEVFAAPAGKGSGTQRVFPDSSWPEAAGAYRVWAIHIKKLLAGWAGLQARLGKGSGPVSAQLPAELKSMMLRAELNLGGVHRTLQQLRMDAATTALIGQFKAGRRDSLRFSPPWRRLADDSTVGDGWLQDAWAYAVGMPAEHRGRSHAIARVGELQAESLQLAGDTDGAVVALQRVLDEDVTGRVFTRIEEAIHIRLGLAQDSSSRELGRWEKGLAGCDTMDLRVGERAATYRAIRRSGFQGIDANVGAWRRACPKLDRQTALSLTTHAALAAGRLGDCARFRRYMAEAVGLGLPKEDLGGYRRNHVPNCP